MMLPGRLSSTTLGDVLGALHREGANGILELIEPVRGTSGERKHRVEFLRGLVQRIDSPLGAPRLGEILRERGVLSAAGHCVEALLSQPEPIGKALVNAAWVSSDVVCVALRAQLRTRIEALFQVTDATLRFHVAPRKTAEGVRAVPLVPAEFLRGRPRLRDVGFNRPTQKSLADAPSTAENATFRRLRFRALAKQMHPDRFPEASHEERALLVQRFSELSAHYHRL